MKSVVQHPVYGQIAYEESVWTGKKELYINGAKLLKQSKTSFVYTNGSEPLIASVKGNFLAGTRLSLGGEVIELTPTAKWYEIVCSVLIFTFILIWGNNAALCAILPVVGGAIGGAISGVMAMLNLMLMKSTRSIALKLVIWIGMFAATFLICFLIGSAIVALLS